MSEQTIKTIGVIVACIGGGIVVVIVVGVVIILIMARLGIFDCFKEV